ncbi:penicillin acylase family protein [Occultella glacieicola]|uniref:Penicillin acylase family protein n=1 Tax=Occultella glacieicola TaxID=2518684 RepID=A0ABY2E3X1_9MICO|nr:penicillin acylase family protein [Occultella glacieicola]
MSVARRIALAVAVFLVVVLVAGVITTVIFVRRPLPSHSGTQQVDGLSAEVEIIRDRLGIPQIYADDAEDLFMAQGYVHAQDRFFEMDYRRHVTAGRLSELVGPVDAALAADTVTRTLGWRQVAEQEFDLLDPASRSYLTAYADGVNAYLESRQPSQLGLEYTVLGMSVDVGTIEPWDPVDSLAWLKAMSWDLLSNYGDELGRAAVFGQVGDLDMVDALYPAYDSSRNLPILPTAAEVTAQEEAAAAEETQAQGMDLTGGDSDRAEAGSGVASDPYPTALAADAGEAVRTALDAIPALLGTGEGLGSNSWVVSGEHTVSGRPLLANDPHLGLGAPGIWYQVGLHCRTVSEQCPFDVAGFSFSGLPGVVIGQNADLAWGLTNLTSDASDFFLERVYSDGTYLRAGDRLPLTERTEVIEVNGGDDVTITVQSTPHGPIISDAILGSRAAGDAPLPDGAPPTGLSGYAIALSWTALTPGRTADALFAMNRAVDADDVAAAAALFDSPSQSFVFATADGQIGYQAAGAMPIRADVPGAVVPSDGRWPRLGWDPAYDWQGLVAPEQMPSVVDPAEGFIVTANQAVTSPGNTPDLATDVDRGYRAQRIRDLITEQIAAGEPFTAADMTRIQLDEVNPYAQMLVPVLQRIRVPNDFVAEAVDLFDDWDRVNDADSPAAAYFAAVWTNLLRLTFWDQVPEAQRPSGGSVSLDVIRNLLEDEASPWWDDRATLTVVEQRDEILGLALVDARAQLTVSQGKDPADWRWGRSHQIAPTHALLGGDGVPGVVSNYFNPDPFAIGGGSSSVNATSWDASAWAGGYPDLSVTSGPSMRMVVDLADRDASTWQNFLGSSGHPTSGNYDDQFDRWASGEPYPWAFTRAAVEESEDRTLTLAPPG